MIANQEVKKYFDEKATTYAENMSKKMALVRSAYIKKYVFGDILDVGVGPGYLASLYSDGKISACDISSSMIEIAKKQLPLATLKVCDAESIDFSSQSFDSIVSSELIYYLENKAKFFEECKRLLRPGGQIILVCGNPYLSFPIRFLSFFGLMPDDPFHTQKPSASQLAQSLQAYFPADSIFLDPISPLLGLQNTDLSPAFGIRIKV